MDITEQEYEEALRRIDQLLPLVDDSTPADDINLRELLAASQTVMDYEKIHYPIGAEREPEVTIADATADDTREVAWTVLTALDMPTDHLDWMTASCADEKSMYSWNKAIIARVDGEPVGCLVAYPGDGYEQIREYTWSRLWNDADPETIKATEIETYPGEYYLDSLAIRPEFRGRGIGKLLIEAAIERGRKLGYRTFALIVSIEKPRLQAYYESLGFAPAGKVNFFGHRYNRLLRREG